ncbi:MAG: hypothetical protein M1275_03275 [Patescibacteria group bacterium]|nr:hypothetical protein [Patescibacteria group bacterium]
MNTGKIVESFHEEESEQEYKRQRLDEKKRLAVVMSRLENVRKLKASLEFKKYRRLVIAEVVEVMKSKLRRWQTPNDQMRFIQGHLSALEQYFDLDLMEAFYERELVKSKRPLNANDDYGEENDEEG